MEVREDPHGFGDDCHKGLGFRVEGFAGLC